MAGYKNKGFTLIELVIGIAVLAVAMMLMNLILLSYSKNTLTPLHQLRASQLGQSILVDILSRAHDTKTDKQSIDSLDRFETSGFEPITRYANTLGYDLPTQYNNYQIKLVIVNEYIAIIDSVMKRIDVTLKTPTDDEIVFSVLKGTD
jgi:MSHA pilin protein MshD